MSPASQLAPTGTLRVAVWMVPYFARAQGGGLSGIIPDLAAALAREAGVGLDLVPFENPAKIVAAFRDGALDVTFVGITADRAEAIDFGPRVFEIQTTYLVPASSAIARIEDIDRAGVRIAVPARSAQEAHLTKIITAATLIPVPAETPQRAIDLVQAGEADAFSHVAPMLAGVQGALPGSRILPAAISTCRSRSGWPKVARRRSPILRGPSPSTPSNPGSCATPSRAPAKPGSRSRLRRSPAGRAHSVRAGGLRVARAREPLARQHMAGHARRDGVIVLTGLRQPAGLAILAGAPDAIDRIAHLLQVGVTRAAEPAATPPCRRRHATAGTRAPTAAARSRRRPGFA